MPVRKVTRGGKMIGYRYGTRGKVYPTRAQADRQGRAIKAAQYRRSKRG